MIHADRCIGCGLCVRVCPSQTLSMKDGKAVVSGDRSLGCGHCAAVCPAEAVEVRAADPDVSTFATFAADSRWLPPGKSDTAQLVRLMASRRSCRNFKEAPVDRALLEDLVRIGAAAPSGTNSQGWAFTTLPTRESVLFLGNQVAQFFRRVNKLAENGWVRTFLRLAGRPELDQYHREYRQSVSEALDEWQSGGKDRLFHGAAAAIVVGSRPEATTPGEDALLATQNMLLAAHSMGLGTCLIGFAVVAMVKDSRIPRSLGIPAEEAVHAVVALGHPDEAYVRVAGRKPFVRRSFETR